ncbi:MAG: isoprenylcysteine carboxylmethyltransferase family protein [Clostridium sp.]|nr:isoprenylcysteine carboxylmethyltransferase family protein [Clostridium sp.]
MDKKLFIQAITKFILGFIIIALLLFLPAGTLNYWNAWLFICILFVPMFIVGIILMIKNPNLLRKRLNAKEKESEQEMLLLLGGVMFICGFIVSGLNYRLNWIILPKRIVFIATLIFISTYILYGEVLRENMYLSRIIEIQEDQKVIDTGLYSIVRHPMYSSTILLFLSIPLILGSLLSFLIFMLYPIIIANRIKNEEQVLEQGLKGYSEYKKKVKYKVVPFIW